MPNYLALNLTEGIGWSLRPSGFTERESIHTLKNWTAVKDCIRNCEDEDSLVGLMWHSDFSMGASKYEAGRERSCSNSENVCFQNSSIFQYNHV